MDIDFDRWKYEYRNVCYSGPEGFSGFIDQLNNWSQQGWELVNFTMESVEKKPPYKPRENMFTSPITRTWFGVMKREVVKP